MKNFNESFDYEDKIHIQPNDSDIIDAFNWKVKKFTISKLSYDYYSLNASRSYQ